MLFRCIFLLLLNVAAVCFASAAECSWFSVLLKEDRAESNDAIWADVMIRPLDGEILVGLRWHKTAGSAVIHAMETQMEYVKKGEIHATTASWPISGFEKTEMKIPITADEYYFSVSINSTLGMTTFFNHSFVNSSPQIDIPEGSCLHENPDDSQMMTCLCCGSERSVESCPEVVRDEPMACKAFEGGLKQRDNLSAFFYGVYRLDRDGYFGTQEMDIMHIRIGHIIQSEVYFNGDLAPPTKRGCKANCWYKLPEQPDQIINIRVQISILGFIADETVAEFYVDQNQQSYSSGKMDYANMFTPFNPCVVNGGSFFAFPTCLCCYNYLIDTSCYDRSGLIPTPPTALTTKIPQLTSTLTNAMLSTTHSTTVKPTTTTKSIIKTSTSLEPTTATVKTTTKAPTPVATASKATVTTLKATTSIRTTTAAPSTTTLKPTSTSTVKPTTLTATTKPITTRAPTTATTSLKPITTTAKLPTTTTTPVPTTSTTLHPTTKITTTATPPSTTARATILTKPTTTANTMMSSATIIRTTITPTDEPATTVTMTMTTTTSTVPAIVTTKSPSTSSKASTTPTTFASSTPTGSTITPSTKPSTTISSSPKTSTPASVPTSTTAHLTTTNAVTTTTEPSTKTTLLVKTTTTRPQGATTSLSSSSSVASTTIAIPPTTTSSSTTSSSTTRTPSSKTSTDTITAFTSTLQTTTRQKPEPSTSTSTVPINTSVVSTTSTAFPTTTTAPTTTTESLSCISDPSCSALYNMSQNPITPDTIHYVLHNLTSNIQHRSVNLTGDDIYYISEIVNKIAKSGPLNNKNFDEISTIIDLTLDAGNNDFHDSDTQSRGSTERILDSIDIILKSSANTVKYLKGNNLALAAHNPDCSGLTSNDDGLADYRTRFDYVSSEEKKATSPSASIIIPLATICSSKVDRVYYAIYRNSKLFIPSDQQSKRRKRAAKAEDDITPPPQNRCKHGKFMKDGRVLTATALKSSENGLQKMTYVEDNDTKERYTMAVISYSHHDTLQPLHGKFGVSWWKDASYWSSDLCSVHGTSKGFEAHCDHLTDFTLIVDGLLTEPCLCNVNLVILGYVIGTFSLAGLVFLAILYGSNYSKLLREQELIKKLRGNPSATADDAVSLLYIITMMLFYLSFTFFSDRTVAGSACNAFAGVNYWLLLSCLTFTMCQALRTLRAFAWSSIMEKILYFITRDYIVISLSYGVSSIVVITFAVVITDFFKRKDDYCWIRPDYVIVSVVVPLSILVACGFVCFGLIIMRLFPNVFKPRSFSRGSSRALQRSKNYLKRKIVAILLMQFTLGIPWVFQYLTLFAPEVTAWHYLFTIVNGSQGVTLFLLYLYRRILLQRQKRRSKKLASLHASGKVKEERQRVHNEFYEHFE